jgi:hypothetical protein
VIPLPEKGDVQVGLDALIARLTSVTETDEDTIHVRVSLEGEVRGDEGAVRSVYGDLFDIPELAVAAEGPVVKFIRDIAFGEAPDVALRSMYMLAVAHGVLIERARWRKDER